MAFFTCKSCGGDLEISQNQSVGVCEYCGKKQTLPKLDSERKENLYKRANHFRRNNDYDKAMGIYEQILNEDTTDAEAYWSLVLCHYGIEYVTDPATKNKIPTVNRAQFTSIYADANYKEALNYATEEQKAVFEREAKTIDDIQKGILSISEKEKPYDVFICYKETDENGDRTPDSVVGYDLYQQLTKDGYKVFFSRITLEDKLGQEFEPYIFAALNSAKVMVVLGTKLEYFNAVWVKNEWSRYMSLISSGAKKTLIPAYKNVDPYELPDEFSHLQAQDMSKLGFMQDLTRGIKKIIDADKKPEKKETVYVQNNTVNNVDINLKRGYIELADEDWEKAEDFFEEALNYDPESSDAYIGKLLADYELKSMDEFVNYYKNMSLGGETNKHEACPYDKERVEKAVEMYSVGRFLPANIIRDFYKFDSHYFTRVAGMKRKKLEIVSEINDDKNFRRAKQYAKGEKKEQIAGYYSSIVAEFDRKIELAQKDESTKIKNIKESYAKHLDSADAKAKEMNEKVVKDLDSQYEASVEAMNKAKTSDEIKQVISKLTKISGYKDTNELIRKCEIKQDSLYAEETVQKNKEIRRKKRNKTIIKIAAVAAGILLIVAVFGIISIKSIVEAKKELKKIADAKEGDIVTYGNYNGEIEWIVLKKDGDSVLLTTKYGVEKKPFHNDKIVYSDNLAWSACSLRNWLNGDFYNKAFSEKEKENMKITSVAQGKIIFEDTKTESEDYVAILTHEQVFMYFNKENRAIELADGSHDRYWIRDIRIEEGIFRGVGCINSKGEYDRDVKINNDTMYVRPTIWVDISSVK